MRGRDLLSVVARRASARPSASSCRAGYRVEWGGQFQHYEEAKRRLVVVVPLALGADRVLLCMALGSLARCRC